MMLPYVVEYSLIGNLERYRDVAQLPGERINGLSVKEGAAKAAVATKRILKESGLPTPLKEVGVKEEAFAEMADKISKSRYVALSPRIPTKEHLIALYRQAYQGFE